MALLSPGISIKEKDFSTIVPTVATSIGGIAGEFTQGPISTPILITSESELADIFGKPTETNFGTWFAAAQFLNYANKLWVVRAATSGCKNAANGTAALIKNYSDFISLESSLAGTFFAKQPGTYGNALKVLMVDNGNYDLLDAKTGDAYTYPELQDNSGVRYKSWIPTKPGTSTYVKDRAIATPTTKYDEVSVLIIDVTGEISGKANTVIESFNYLSKAVDAVDYKQTSLYIKDVLNTRSQYVYFVDTPTNSSDIDSVTGSVVAWGAESYDAAGADKNFQKLKTVATYSLSGGVAGSGVVESDIKDAYNEFANPEEIDVNLLITGNHPVGAMAHVIELAAARKDAVAFVTPHNSGAPYTTRSTMTANVVAFKASLNIADQFQSYAVMDSGFKYIYDSYNRRYRWVALNGDTAGIVARNDDLTDPWWSPGGFNRGGVRNIVKLSWNPNQSERDIIYPQGINPVVTFPGSGTILFGDRTMQEKPSAFDRINVRRLFIVLEKAISTAAKYTLFEFNDSFTRAQFRNMVEPFLRDVQGRRGLTDFKVICDESNNTGEVIDRNEFKADIYLKPARSINFIYLSFVATKTGVDFSTVVGG